MFLVVDGELKKETKAIQAFVCFFSLSFASIDFKVLDRQTIYFNFFLFFLRKGLLK